MPTEEEKERAIEETIKYLAKLKQPTIKEAYCHQGSTYIETTKWLVVISIEESKDLETREREFKSVPKKGGSPVQGAPSAIETEARKLHKVPQRAIVDFRHPKKLVRIVGIPQKG